MGLGASIVCVRVLIYVWSCFFGFGMVINLGCRVVWWFCLFVVLLEVGVVMLVVLFSVVASLCDWLYLVVCCVWFEGLC